jgi:hypothetical protein
MTPKSMYTSTFSFMEVEQFNSRLLNCKQLLFNKQISTNKIGVGC